MRSIGHTLGFRSNGNLITRWPIKPIQSHLEESSCKQTSELCFIHWDDIARANWPRHPLELIKQCSLFASFYLLNGTVIKIAKLCPGVAICGAYPLMFLFFALISTFLIANSSQIFLDFLGLNLFIQFLAIGLITFLILWQFWRLSDRLGVTWLTRSILFTHRLGQARDMSLRHRIKELAKELIQTEKETPARTIRLIGHSSGTFVLAMLAAELRRHPETEALMAKLKLLTLGQNLANLAVYPKAKFFRDDLITLSTYPRISWTDVTSKVDLLCFAGVNPYISCGLPKPKGEPYPTMKIIDLAKAKGLSNVRDILIQQFTLHFDYLRSHCSDVDLPSLLISE